MTEKTQPRTALMDLRGNRTLTEVAQLLDITPQYLGEIERGVKTPSFTVLKKIVEFYSVKIEDVF